MNSDLKELNALINENSPYLLQHAHNPVDWFPWGPEAFQRARREARPVFLSIGYATCHWCHVMAHESFEHAQVAQLLNQDFVAVKVDREERPDVDRVYMNACQAMTRGGGWPLSIFMTPDGKPFFAGTYFPREGRMGMPGFVDLLRRIAHLWAHDRERLLRVGDEVVRILQPEEGPAGNGPLPGLELLEKASGQLRASFDPRWGGFGAAPKFPTPHNLTFLLRWHHRSQDPAALQCVEKTLQAMHNGGIFDQIGFGFHRYSVDEQWGVPHFEKMLYDQAQLALAFVEAFQATGRPRYARAARQVFQYVLRDMTSPEGAFASAEDADSEGREGRFYAWTPAQVREVLGVPEAELFCRFYDITAGGNFEDGLSVPRVLRETDAFARAEGIPEESLRSLLEDAREKLFRARLGRIHPLKDDKILTAWNGLMIAALARGARALQEPAFARAAGNAARFVLERLSDGDGGLLRRYREGEAILPGYLDDYAFLVWGLTELYEATFDADFLGKALELTTRMLERFWDPRAGGFFFSGAGNESLIVQSKEAYDQALPSGNSVAVLNLLRLGRMTGDPAWEERAVQTVRAFAPSLSAAPAAHTQFLLAVDFLAGPSREIVIAGEPEARPTREMLRAVHQRFLPRSTLLLNPPGPSGNRIRKIAPHLSSRDAGTEGAAAHVCERFSCRRPVTSAEALCRLLDGP